MAVQLLLRKLKAALSTNPDVTIFYRTGTGLNL